MNRNDKSFAAPISIAALKKQMFPSKESWELPKIVFVDSKNVGYASGELTAGEYTLVKMFRKELPHPAAERE